MNEEILNKEVFSGKKLSDLIKEIYEKQKENDLTVKDKIDLLSTFINTPGDAIVIVPLLKELIDAGLKNDETLLKIVQLFKVQQEKKSSTQEVSSGILTEKDIEQLFNDVNNTKTEIKQITN